MSQYRLLLLLLILFSSTISVAQTDSVVQILQNIPKHYITNVENKISSYTSRVTRKTEKTLTKLAKWETKIKTLLEKANPETAQRLFGNNQLTFATALEKYKQGEAIIANQRARYDEYIDKLTTSIKYLDEKKELLNSKLIQPVKTAKENLAKLEEEQTQTDAIQQFIRERRRQLIDQAISFIGKSKYLAKINSESYYYIETLKNYKEIFSDKKKAEETALTLLNKIPAFQKFMQQNSMLASLFRMPGANGLSSPSGLGALQTRASVNALIQNQIAAGGPNAQAQITQNIQAAQAELSKLKDKILKAGGSSSDAEMPDFKPKDVKSKTFKQRLEVGSNFQFAKTNVYQPTAADIGLSLGYKLNDKSVIGLGASYKMGLGSIQHISITHNGVGLRSFIDWKLKKQFFMSGGYEMNYNAQFKNIEQLKAYNSWQQSGLVGISKKINIKTKFFKSTKLSLLYDMLARQHVPVSQPVVFRVGYHF